MMLTKICSLDKNPEPLELVDVPCPKPGPHDILLRIATCGVCHTELDEIEGRTAPPVLPVIPGHEVVGHVEQRGNNARRFAVDDRVGVGWIYSSSGVDDENISPEFRATGRDVNGGYAEYLCVNERYAYPVPECFTDAQAAPLLCAGGVGYRALKLAALQNGQILGLTGFGGSGHLVLQLAQNLYPDSQVYVFARSQDEREFAMDLGAAWSGDTEAMPPAAPDAIIDTTPAWRPVLAALRALRPGGRLIINAIRKEDKDKHLMAEIDYAKHLWQEKEIKTVANVTARDIGDFLELAAKCDLQPEVQIYPLEQANTALRDLKAGNIRGAKVLAIGTAI